MTTTQLKQFIEDYVQDELETKTFEELLEEHDLTPGFVFHTLFTIGLIDEELMETITAVR